MIHVCRLDVGSRHVFDSADGINDVGSLSAAIEHYFNIEKHKQILLISGGEILNDHTQKLYRLSAGREESPIYLIDQKNVEKDHPPTVDMPLDSLTQDMRKEIEAAIQLKPSFSTLQTRMQLSSKVYELGKKLHSLCQSFYDDQYWQYQGFLALIANLDEYFNSFCKKKDVINEQFEKYLNSRDYNKELMREIDKYIDVMSSLRILPQIMSQINLDNTSTSTTSINESTQLNTSPATPSEHLFNNFSSQSIADLQELQINERQLANTTVKNNTGTNLTLLDWIKSTDPQNKLSTVIDETREMLHHFDNNFNWELLQTKINKLVDQIENNAQMREIEGLTKRLQDLNNFLEMSKKFLAGQQDIVESFNANYERAAKLKDDSILKDLCAGHEMQLEVFKSNHDQMIEITRKISKAKLELIRVVHSRLNWVMQIQKQLADHDFQLQVYFKQLKRIGARVKLIDMIKRAPGIYLCSVREIVRRQGFSKVYKNFADLLNSLVSKIYTNEMDKRQAFDTKLSSSSHHFILNILFRCLQDRPKPLLAETPLKFDSQLPQLEEHEISGIETDLINHLSTLRSSSFDSSSTTSSSSTSAVSSSSSGQNQMDNSSPMFESPQTSATKSSESTCSSSNKCHASKITKFSENFMLELGLDDYKSHDDLDLCMLSALSEILSQKKVCKEMVKVDSGLGGQVFNGQDVAMKIADIRLKLSESKEILKTFNDEFKNEANKILIRQSELVESLQIHDGQASDQIEFDLKSIFYSDILAFINRPETPTASPEFLEKFDQYFKNNVEEKQFFKSLHESIKELKISRDKEVTDLQASLNMAKKNVNADKQKLFNEAIKRATQEKDKVIEELRGREASHLAKIEELEAALNNNSNQASKAHEPISLKISTEKENNLPVIPETIDGLETVASCGNNDTEDINQTKMKLRELMLLEKISQLEKQLTLFTTLPVTNDYETIQLNSCNIDDLVIAVYSEEYGSYKIIHKSSNYLHFVHSAIFKSYEQRLSFKTNSVKSGSGLQLATSPISESTLSGMVTSESSELQFGNPNDISVQSSSFQGGIPISVSTTSDGLAGIAEAGSTSHSPIVRNSPNDNIQNIFLAEKQPQWFIGRVLVKEFCIARKENNRFRVPSGTRFYRVKLKPHNL